MTCQQAHQDGSYVLGCLSPSERTEFEQHLTECEDCRRSVRELAVIPELLGRLVVSPTLNGASNDMVLTSARRRPTRRR